MAGLSLKKRKIERQKKFATFLPLSSRFFGYIFPPPKTALFGERTLSKATALHEAQRRRKGVDFHGKGEPRFRATRREKRGKQQRSVSGFRLISSAAKSHFASVTSKMRRAHFPNERSKASE